MEQAESVDVAVNEEARVERLYEKYGWMILAVGAIFGIIAAVLTTYPPEYIRSSSFFEDTYPIMGALGVTWVGFSLLALVVILIPFRRGERWVWFTLWMLPMMWLAQFALGSDLPYYLVLAIITTVGLPARRCVCSLLRVVVRLQDGE